MANSGYDLLNGWESMEFEELGQQNLYNYRGLATSHPQFGQIAATGGKGISMPYAIKPAGYSEQQIIDMYGSVEAWEKSYVDDGSSSWARSAYYQMLADGYSDAEARKGTNWYDEIAYHIQLLPLHPKLEYLPPIESSHSSDYFLKEFLD